MSGVSDLVKLLKKTGIPMNESIIEALLSTEPSDFTDFPLESFWQDYPVPFLVTDAGVTKTISAPHMIATMLHHLELRSGLHVVMMGSKGGYLATLIDKICGPSPCLRFQRSRYDTYLRHMHTMARRLVCRRAS